MNLFVYDPATNELEDRGIIVPGLIGERRDIMVGPDGKLISLRGNEALRRAKTPADVLKRIQGRVRKLTVAIPSRALRPGQTRL